MLSQVYAWAISVPFEQLSTALHSGAGIVAVELAKISVAAGFLEQIFRVMQPAVEQTLVVEPFRSPGLRIE